MPVRTTRDGAMVRVFTSFEEENETDHARWAALTPQERWGEFAPPKPLTDMSAPHRDLRKVWESFSRGH